MWPAKERERGMISYNNNTCQQVTVHVREKAFYYNKIVAVGAHPYIYYYYIDVHKQQGALKR